MEFHLQRPNPYSTKDIGESEEIHIEMVHDIGSTEAILSAILEAKSEDISLMVKVKHA